MPMQLPNGTLLQMLLSPGNVMTSRKVLNDLLSRPAAWEKSCLGVRKTPFDVRYEAVIGARGTEVVRVLEIQGSVSSAY